MRKAWIILAVLLVLSMFATPAAGDVIAEEDTGYSLIIQDDAGLLTHSTYVYKSGMDLGIVGRYGNNLVLIGYSPMTKRAEYYITDAGSSMSDVALELAVSQLDTEGYYKNDVEDVVGVLKDLSEALGG